jgi:UDP-N-acetylmuramate dehydrogenase
MHPPPPPVATYRTCRILRFVPSNLQILENVPLAPYTTFQIGGPARFFAEAFAEADIETALAFARVQNLPLFILGGGSNLLVRDTGFPGLVLHIAIPGIQQMGDDTLDVGAGVSWDTLVDHVIDLNLAGIECLAGIPGLTGGTPVQNVGAYGQEVSETIASVRALDRETNTWVELDNSACHFRYRESLFNTDQPNRYIVTRVRFRLRPNGSPTLRYADLQRRFSGTAVPTLAEVAATVREIRQTKGMLISPGDPDTRSAGSFFKNPIVAASALERIATALTIPSTEIPHWPATGGRIKLPAAWLLEKAGFVKGFGTGPARISTRHTLALTNRDNATCADIESLQNEIIARVSTKFGLTLEREPVLLG